MVRAPDESPFKDQLTWFLSVAGSATTILMAYGVPGPIAAALGIALGAGLGIDHLD